MKMAASKFVSFEGMTPNRRLAYSTAAADTQGVRFKGSNVAVFALFFGIALIEAVQERSFVQAALFAALGVLALWADFHKGSGQ